MFRIPPKGLEFEKVLARLEKLKAKENHAEEGKLFGYVYTSDLQVGGFGYSEERERGRGIIP